MPRRSLKTATLLGTLTSVLFTSCKSAHSSAEKATPAAASSSATGQPPQTPSPMPGHIRLRRLPPVTKGVESLPRVVPNDTVTPEQAARLNAIFDRYDRKSLETLHECKQAMRKAHEEDLGGEYSNNISVLMRGPRYLSILVRESYDECGGPHPEDSKTSLVYDITAGRKLNLLAIFPGSHPTDPAHPVDADTVVWSPFQRAAQEQAQEAAQKDTDPEDDCRPTYQDKNMAFVVWLDAEGGSIDAYPAGLSHIESATCGEEVHIPLTTARSLGVSPELISELEIAHTAAQQAAAAKKIIPKPAASP